ncbi:hypothetical protein AGABI1DRAFT_96504 [Agaricus bisporus var. burnettii JB137-S8]|nr:uncharacterized protein AGABI1DRAFT_96504 [Agaricus bisporus var. burnettii JB137-S8]EKM83517.1 hypothetical protein AGABI1DRAFT_96504 [Agaricus bisporus var. burnettii JB137-S8]
MDELMEYLEDPGTNDSPSSSHLMLQEQRIVRHYLRLIEHEMPHLAALRKPFVPPTSEQPLVVRSIEYVGSKPTIKRSMVVAVDDLPLKDEKALKRLVLLAGPRWTPSPPADAGISKHAEWKHGFVKISCEDFMQPARNLKWISDTLDRLVERANSPAKEDGVWDGLPVDLRHVMAKSKKGKKGDHLRGRVLAKPTLRDFPREWLPKLPTTHEQPSLSSS